MMARKFLAQTKNFIRKKNIKKCFVKKMVQINVGIKKMLLVQNVCCIRIFSTEKNFQTFFFVPLIFRLEV